eukprot:gene24211-9810_t
MIARSAELSQRSRPRHCQAVWRVFGGTPPDTPEDREARANAADRAAARQSQFENSAVGKAAYRGVAEAKRPVANPEQRRAEQRRAEQRRAEQRRAEQHRAEQRRAEQRRAEQRRAEQRRAEQRRAEQRRAASRTTLVFGASRRIIVVELTGLFWVN